MKRGTMRIQISGLDTSVVAKLDELASKQNVSRNEFLKNKVEYIASANEVFEVENKYSIMLDKVLKVLDYNTIALNKILKENFIELEKAVEESENN